MKNLLYKEFVLCMNLRTVILLSLAPGLIFIPNYPCYVSIYYVCLAMMLLFAFDSSNNDLLFNATLPIRRRDIIKSRVLFIAILEMAEIILCAIAGFVCIFVLGRINLAGISPTVAFLGFSLLLFSVTNFSFCVMYYKNPGTSAYGKSFVVSTIVFWILYALCEIPIWRDTAFGKYIDAVDFMSQIQQLPILGAGIIIYCLMIFFTCRVSEKKFERVNI